MALIERLRAQPSARVVDFAYGSGRNRRALEAAGLRVTAISDELAALPTAFDGVAEPQDALLSTHGFLHGTRAEVVDRLRRSAAALAPGALLYATFGSTRDARCGAGTRLAEGTYAPDDGDERGVAHAFFDETALREALEEAFAIERLEERTVDEIAGTWAHREHPLARSAHWFAIAVRR